MQSRKNIFLAFAVLAFSFSLNGCVSWFHQSDDWESLLKNKDQKIIAKLKELQEFRALVPFLKETIASLEAKIKELTAGLEEAKKYKDLYKAAVAEASHYGNELAKEKLPEKSQQKEAVKKRKSKTKSSAEVAALKEKVKEADSRAAVLDAQAEKLSVQLAEERKGNKDLTDKISALEAAKNKGEKESRTALAEQETQTAKHLRLNRYQTEFFALLALVLGILLWRKRKS